MLVEDYGSLDWAQDIFSCHDFLYKYVKKLILLEQKIKILPT